MQLTALASKPILIKVSIDDEDTIEKYGEPIDFYIYDRQSMDTFVKLATIDYSNFSSVTEVIRELVLNEQGTPVVFDDVVLPTDLLMKAINVVIETLGKSVTPPTKKVIKTSK